MEYILNYVQNNITQDLVIAKATNGSVYYLNDALHFENDKFHYIYKFNDDIVGWYMQNLKTGQSYFLGYGACPCLDFDNLQVEQNEIWQNILLK